MLIYEHNQCEEIIENFNWDKVHKVMQHLNWEWGFNPKVPTLDEVKDKARELLKVCFDRCETDSKYTTGTGGLEATVISENGLKTAELKFVLTEWETHYHGEKWD